MPKEKTGWAECAEKSDQQVGSQNESGWSMGLLMRGTMAGGQLTQERAGSELEVGGVQMLEVLNAWLRNVAQCVCVCVCVCT